MIDVLTMRQGPLDHLAGAQGGAFAALSIAPPTAKFSLRCRDDAIASAGRAFGIALPETACRAAVAGDHAALSLGPDEWLLLAPEGEGQAVTMRITAALAGTHHSLIDVSHRSCGCFVQGAHAATVINQGCPLDLSRSSFPVGACTRTLFEKAEIILWRTDTQAYRLEAERSFAPYVWTMLVELRREFE